MPRVGLEHIQAVVLEDALGICAELDERMQASIDDYVDPWTRPHAPGQFESSLPLVPLPQVPVRVPVGAPVGGS